MMLDAILMLLATGLWPVAMWALLSLKRTARRAVATAALALSNPLQLDMVITADYKSAGPCNLIPNPSRDYG